VDGDGYGYGSGSGDGYGYGDETYWKKAVASYVSRWPESQQAVYRAAVASGAQIAYWKSAADGRPCNGGSSDPVSSGQVQEIAGPLRICSSQALHGTLIPPKWKGDRTWIVALYGETQSEEDKLAALKRQILGEC